MHSSFYALSFILIAGIHYVALPQLEMSLAGAFHITKKKLHNTLRGMSKANVKVASPRLVGRLRKAGVLRPRTPSADLISIHTAK